MLKLGETARRSPSGRAVVIQLDLEEDDQSAPVAGSRLAPQAVARWAQVAVNLSVLAVVSPLDRTEGRRLIGIGVEDWTLTPCDLIKTRSLFAHTRSLMLAPIKTPT